LLALQAQLPSTSRRLGGQRGIASSSVSQRAVISSLNSFSGVTASESDDERVVRMLMFGKPGAGKGTLSARLTKKYDILSISTGDLLRQHINEGTEVGKQAEAIIAQGELVPDDVMLKVITSKLDCLQDKVCLQPASWDCPNLRNSCSTGFLTVSLGPSTKASS
jgi:adenylate kinase